IVSGQNPINIAYTGKYHDEITNLQWNINRWYDSNLGQWISQDPIGFNAGDVNLYRYVGNNPIDKIDPKGLEDWNDSWLDYIYPSSWGAWFGNLWGNASNCMNAAEHFNEQRARELNDISNGNGDAGRALNTKVPTEVTETIKALANVNLTYYGLASGSSTTLVSGVRLQLTIKKIQHEYRHAYQFGVTGNWNKENAVAFGQAIIDHVSKKNIQVIQGTYRGNIKVTHYFDDKTNLNVMIDENGDLVGAWKLDDRQLKYLHKGGNVQ
ncbi:MAG: hypothetical protein LBT09_11740, partial [Planctomycetaceae bacterium]|nr:hypothetical protein [Planctomycetaceae bacterium]